MHIYINWIIMLYIENNIKSYVNYISKNFKKKFLVTLLGGHFLKSYHLLKAHSVLGIFYVNHFKGRKG